MTESGVSQRMREDWNRRAREDANYYVAFGRRDQDDEEFFATAKDVVRGLEWDLKRLAPGGNPRARRALEIGCGPGRLIKPMSPHFGEVHGVDVSDEMIRRAREKLRGIPHVHVHATAGGDLAQFADDSFDFAWSYAVFQHIPSRDVVLGYMSEIVRVLKPGGVFKGQFNGLPAESIARCDTWSGVKFTAGEIRDFARGNSLQLLALEGSGTQYMWTTWRKSPPCAAPAGPARIRRVTNAHSSEPVAPPRGRFSSISLWVENLPAGCDLNTLEVTVGGRPGFATYLGPPESDGLVQLNSLLPPGLETGIQPVQLRLLTEAIAEPARIRVVPPPPAVPRVVSVTDGVNFLSGTRIVSGSIKISVEEVDRPELLHAAVDGIPLTDRDIFCADPLLPRHEVNFRLPAVLAQGRHTLSVSYRGKLLFAALDIDLAK